MLFMGGEFWGGMDLRKLQEKYMTEWLQALPPLAFSYGIDDFEYLVEGWTLESKTQDTQENVTHVQTYSDPSTKLKVAITYKSYKEFPAIDWVVEITNEGSETTPILENILPMQMSWNSPDQKPPVLHYSNGSDYKDDDFIPMEKKLIHWKQEVLTSEGGRSSNGILPFFNLQTGNLGMIMAIGWSGQWKLALTLNRPNNEDPYEVYMEAGMENTHLVLYPGEKIRTPRMLILFWEGDRNDAHNQWRQLILNHYSPTIQGKRVQVPLSYPTWGATRMEDHSRLIKTIDKEHLGYEYYWTDAGWYVPDELPADKYDEFSGEWANYVGRWIPNSILYPNGVQQLSNEIHQIGLKFLLWFEPERARPGTDLPNRFPQYFQAKSSANSQLMFKLGDPEARAFLIDFISSLITQFNIDCYRQDFNFDPLDYWKVMDKPNRQGMAEIQHIMGLYEYWDELRTKHPRLLIDNCASGGRRIDLETISRSIPLWRSDLQCFDEYNPVGSQIQTFALNRWVPLNSCGTRYCPGDTYKVRSAFSTGLVFHHVNDYRGHYDEPYPWNWHKKMIAEFKRAREFFEGDFYPFTDCKESTKDWMAFQYHRPDLEAGMIMAFRRKDSVFTQAEFPLQGLFEGSYLIEDCDTGEKTTQSAEDLLSNGLTMFIKNRRESKLLFYSKI